MSYRQMPKEKKNARLIEIQSENTKDHQNSYDNSLQLKIKYEECEHKVGCFQSNKTTTCHQTKGTYFAKSGHIMDYSTPMTKASLCLYMSALRYWYM